MIRSSDMVLYIMLFPFSDHTNATIAYSLLTATVAYFGISVRNSDATEISVMFNTLECTTLLVDCLHELALIYCMFIVQLVIKFSTS